MMGGLLAIEVSEAVWLAAIGVITIIVKEYFDSKRAIKAEKKVDEVAVELKQQTGTTVAKLDGLAIAVDEAKHTGESVHTLVNSAMSAQLKISAVALRRLADLTRDRGDNEAADIAEELHGKHESKQRIVDAGQKITTSPTLQPPPVMEVRTRTEAAQEKGE